MKKNISVRILVLLLAVVLCTGFIASCSSQNKTSSDMSAPEYSGNENRPETGSSGDSYYDNGSSEKPSPPKESSGQITDTRKIIKTINLELETKAFNDAVALITSSAAANGGYIEYSYISGDSLQSNKIERKAVFTIRVPASVLDSYVNGLGGSFNVLSKTENSSDITDTYYDAEARLKSLQTQEERLLSMLEGATELQYMLQLEQTLADVRYQIESYYSTIKRYDSQVSLSTVSINLYEVIEYQEIVEKPKTYGERLVLAVKESWENFVEGWKDFSVELVYSIPTLIVLAVFIFVAVLIIKKVTNKKHGGNTGGPSDGRK